MKWRASKTSSSSSSFTSWKISFPFPEKRKKTYLVVGVFHLQVPRKKILRNKMIYLSLERGLSNSYFLILSKGCSIELENIFQIVIYIYTYIYLDTYKNWITPDGYSSQIRGLCFMK